MATTRVIKNTGQPLIDAGGTVISGAKLRFVLVDIQDSARAAFVTDTKEFVAQVVETTTDASGIFSVSLVPNDIISGATYYRVEIPSSVHGYKTFKAPLPTGGSDLQFFDFYALVGTVINASELYDFEAHKTDETLHLTSDEDAALGAANSPTAGNPIATIADVSAGNVTNGDSHDHNGGDGAQIDHVNLANKGTNTHAQIDTRIEALDATQEPTGFPNRTDSVLTFDDGTRTLTLTPAVTDFTFYVLGGKHTKSAADSIVISDVEGTHFVYYNSSGTLVDDPTPPAVGLSTDVAAVATIYWSVAQAEGLLVGDERHGMVMDGLTHSYLHNTVGAAYSDGLAIGNIDADGNGSDNAHAQLDVASGSIYDEDIKHTATDGSPQDLTPIAQVSVFYRTGASGNWQIKVADNFPMVYQGTAGYGAAQRLPYNEWTGATWQFTEVTNNDFVLMHLFATNDINHPVIAVHGQAEYSSISDARTGALTEIGALVGLPFVEFVPIGTIVLKTSNGYSNTPQAAIQSIDNGDNYVDFRSVKVAAGAGGAGDHGGLAGLGDDDHSAIYSAYSSQAGAPSSTPSRVGLINVDTTAEYVYMSKGITSSADWEQVSNSKTKLDATVAPGISNDNTEGYVVGSVWVNVTADLAYICMDASTGAAVWTDISAGAGGGETNTASNLGAGEGVYKTKVGVDLQLRSITATSSKIALANNANDIGFDVAEGNIDHDALSNFVAAEHVLHNIAGTTAPTVNEDSGDGYSAGSLWTDTTNNRAYICLDATVTAAIWREIGVRPFMIDDYYTFTVDTLSSSTQIPTDADSPPTYRVYEDETTVPIMTGSMALLDSANTAGFYSEQIQLTAASGFEVGKSYNIRILATVGGTAGETKRFFKI